MKYILLVLLSYTSINAQDVVFFSNWVGGSDMDAIIVENPSMADICVNRVDHCNQLKMVINSWFITNNRTQANIVLRLVRNSNGNRNAVRVYFNKYINENRSFIWDNNYKLFKNSL